MKRLWVVFLLAAVFFLCCLGAVPGLRGVFGLAHLFGPAVPDGQSPPWCGVGVLWTGRGCRAYLAKSAVPAEQGVSLDWYYGVGVGVGVWVFYGSGGFTLFPHGLAGVEYRFPGMPLAPMGS